MQLSDYLDPVELDRPESTHLSSEELVPHTITINTDNSGLEDLTKYDLIILGVPEDRNSFNKGTALAPDKIRGELYKLVSPINKLKVLDLGNIKSGNTYADTYFALKDICYRLLCNNSVVAIIGGSQDLTIPSFQAFENYQDKINLSIIDSRLDCHKDTITPNSDSFLLELLLKKNKLFKFVHLGHQSYLTEKQSLELVNKLFHEALRLGEIRYNIQTVEPILRDSDQVSFDIGSVRQSDAPGHIRPSANGFYAEEACQLSRYAGIGDRVRLFGIYETNPKLDALNQTTGLAAQILWHFMDGLECRVLEIPENENPNFKTFIVGHSDLDYEMIFFKSMVTQRWWLEVPYVSTTDKELISCTPQDYDTACNHEVPDIWWKTFQKLT